MEWSFLEWVAGVGGVGAVFAVIMFWVYRVDKKSTQELMRQDRIFMEDRLTELLKKYNDAAIENTKVLAELITWLKDRNGH